MGICSINQANGVQELSLYWILLHRLRRSGNLLLEMMKDKGGTA
jgi:hypothetical protein